MHSSRYNGHLSSIHPFQSILVRWFLKCWCALLPSYVYKCIYIYVYIKPLLGGSDGTESACNAEDLGLIPGLGTSPGEGHGNPLHYSCLDNSMGRGIWGATVHEVTESDMTEWLTCMYMLVYLFHLFHVCKYLLIVIQSPLSVGFAGLLERVAISSSRGSSRPRDWTHISCCSCIAGRYFTTEPPGKPLHNASRPYLINWRHG